jgi:hypothetical protein
MHDARKKMRERVRKPTVYNNQYGHFEHHTASIALLSPRARNQTNLLFSTIYLCYPEISLSPFLLVSLSFSLPATASSNTGFYSYLINPSSIYNVTRNQNMRKKLSYHQIFLILYLSMSNSYSSRSSLNPRTPCLNHQPAKAQNS